MIAFSRSWLVLALLVSFTGVANADLFALFSDDGGTTFSNSYTVTTGSTLTIDVFLGQSSPNTELTDEGLFSLGLAATSPSAASAIVTGTTLNPTFDFVSTDSFTSTSIDWEAAVLANAVPMGSEILLGSFDLATTADGVTVFSFGDIQPGTGAANANWLTPDSTVLDELIFDARSEESYGLTIEAVSNVPEPGAAGLVGLFCIALARRRVR
jgi:hypothetical protein